MGAVSSAVMVVLACSPDLMLCREPAGEPAVFASITECRAALAARLGDAAQGPRRIVGRCSPLPAGTTPDRWGISPNGDLFSAGLDDVIASSERSEAAQPAAEPRDEAPIAVRVTRLTPGGPETMTYLVGRD